MDKVADRIRGILEDMLETLHDTGGVGIAAPQVGIMRRMFIAEPEPGEVYYMINPEILEMSGRRRMSFRTGICRAGGESNIC